jgi:hypothetical protein
MNSHQTNFFRARIFLARLFIFFSLFFFLTTDFLSASDESKVEQEQLTQTHSTEELNNTTPRYFYHSDLIVRDEVIFFPDFITEVEKMGSELQKKLNIYVKMLILKTTEEQKLHQKAREVFTKNPEQKIILLAFTKKEKKVDIFASDPKLYETFDKEQILSPYPWSGTILPILGEKIKKDPRHKYAVALFNGYADIVEQVASFHEVELETAVGNSNKYFLNVLRLIFYGVILIALIYYFYKKIVSKKEQK